MIYLSLIILNIFTAATPDLFISKLLATYTLKRVLDKGSTHAVKSCVGSQAQEAGHNVVTQRIIRCFSFKSIDNAGGDIKLQIAQLRAPVGGEWSKEDLESCC